MPDGSGSRAARGSKPRHGDPLRRISNLGELSVGSFSVHLGNLESEY
jgi:hypothetical protein